ncbi:hypothetical protein AAK964_12265 [Tissierella praeacuta]
MKTILNLFKRRKKEDVERNDMLDIVNVLVKDIEFRQTMQLAKGRNQ